MISRDQIQDLIGREPTGNQVLSAFLDMSVNSDQKRTHQVFLNKEKGAIQELDSDRNGHHREAIGEAFARLERWLAEHFDEANKGVAFYVELDGDWLRAHQLPLPLTNRIALGERPVVGPLVQVVESYRHHGVVLVDRETLRIVSFYQEQTVYEREVRTEGYPGPHDIQRGGFSAKDYQKRKAEETRHFFKEFADEVQSFVGRYRPGDLIILGTQENVKHFMEFLPDAVQRLVMHTDRLPGEVTIPEVRAKLAPVFERKLVQERESAVGLLRERVRESHRAVAGVARTLEQLQEGKLQTLVIARDLEQRGGRCEQCGFLLAAAGADCPYCGGQVRDGIDLVEEMVRMAEGQDTRIDFVAARSLHDLGGVGGLLRF